MANSITDSFMSKPSNRPVNIPENNRESMEPEADMDPDEARKFMLDLMSAVYTRMREIPDDEFESPDGYNHIPPMEKAKQFYGSEQIQLLSGIEAALREWDAAHPNDVEEMKEKYQGAFVEGVEIGHRLAVYQGSDFTFSAGSNENNSNDGDSKFTFSA